MQRHPVLPFDRNAHEVDNFACGDEVSDLLLRRYASMRRWQGGARTYVICRERRVLAFYGLTPLEVGCVGLPDARRVQAVNITALAVDSAEQHRGLGTLLFVDALDKASCVARLTGVRLITARVTGTRQQALLAQCGFRPFGPGISMVFLPVQDAQQTLQTV